MKKLCVVLFILILCTVSYAVEFEDVRGTKYEESVSKLVEKGIVNGFDDNTFRPKEPVTRAQIVKMLVGALNLKEGFSNTLNFSDVPTTHWANNFIKIGVGNNIIKGYDDGTFKPDNQVNFVEIATMMLRKMNLDDDLSRLSWPDGYILLAMDNGLFNSVDMGGFDFKVPANRGETSIMINNFLTYLEKEEAKKEAISKENSQELIELDLSKNWNGKYISVKDGYMELTISEDNGNEFLFTFLGYKDGGLKGACNRATIKGNVAEFETEIFDEMFKFTFNRTKEGIKVSTESTNNDYKPLDGLYVIDNGKMNKIEFTNTNRLDAKYRLDDAEIHLSENSNNTISFEFVRKNLSGIQGISRTLNYDGKTASIVEEDFDGFESRITINIKDDQIEVSGYEHDSDGLFNKINGVYKLESKNTQGYTVAEAKQKMRGFQVYEGVTLGF